MPTKFLKGRYGNRPGDHILESKKEDNIVGPQGDVPTNMSVPRAHVQQSNDKPCSNICSNRTSAKVVIQAVFVAIVIAGLGFFIYTFHSTNTKSNTVKHSTKQVETDQKVISGDGNACRTWIGWEEKEEEVKSILTKLDQLMPNVTFTHTQGATSAKNSKATILNHKDSYCVGDHLMVRLDLYDGLGKRKEYGGDFLRARIYSLSQSAAASGLIKNYRNGTYLVNFTLFWEGDARVSLLLIHPSEGASALWTARKKGYDKIAFKGRFLNGTSEVLTECGFNRGPTAELCAYLDDRDQEAFYCVKPKNVPCEAFLSLKSYNTPISYLTDLEQSLLQRSSIGIEIPQKFANIQIKSCKSNKRTTSTKCWVGMSSPFPSGFVWQNQWHPVFCNRPNFNSLEQIYTCLNGKLIYFMGDSTVRQWMENLQRRVKKLQYLDTHSFGKPQELIAVDVAGNIQIQWKKHSHPYISSLEYSVKGHSYIARDIDTVAGDKDTAVVISLGQHFRPFPIEFFIRRAINVRKAIQRLLLRSPDTRVIIKGENIREMDIDQERFSDFHGYAQYLALKDVFRDLNVTFIDAWDMTTAYNTNNVHPQDNVVSNQINMFLSYIC
ncbi:NXPE family member 4-like isoform X3 [Elgaria multicarinata webbii]|uniref:NXPE family member 4-like isoform X3 n=1 Tax=Elgaria multicarinata webbii TaxID=159646 RepID=UPI002FCD1942